MNLLIIQARMGSTRLPGKVLMRINEKTILEHVIDRLRYSIFTHKIIVATTTNKEDDSIELLCNLKAVDCYRGSDWDVLDRFYRAAEKFNPINVIRVTSDCPLNHFSIVDFAVQEFQSSALDYFSNSNHEPDCLEDGFDVEVFKFTALELAWKEAKMLSEREHVTPYIKNSKRFKCAWKKFCLDYIYKLSVDTMDDYITVRDIFKQLSNKNDFGINDVVEFLDQHPKIKEAILLRPINLGFKNSLEQDKRIN